jgi:outer membrane lipoprotein carrier protein
MKNIVASLIVVLLSIQGVLAQYDPEAKSVLDAMSDKYKSAGAFSASFTQQIENQSAGVSESLEGKITVKGGMYKLEILETEIYNNEKEVWVFSPELEEVTVTLYDPTDEEITPGNVYDLYKKGFKYALMAKMGNGDRVIELDPEDREKSFHKIRMIINAKDELKSFTLFEKTGNRYLHTIKDFKPVSSLADSFFTFDLGKYPDVEIVDFR